MVGKWRRNVVQRKGSEWVQVETGEKKKGNAIWRSEFSVETEEEKKCILDYNEVAFFTTSPPSICRRYRKEFQMPQGVQPEQLRSSYSAQGILTVEAPRRMDAPEGAEVQEAMAAKSKAYVTDGGRTSVSEKSQAAEQVIAASTASPDGRSRSTMTYSSSSSSSSSVVTSGGGGGGGGGVGAGHPGLPSSIMPPPQPASFGMMGGGSNQMLDMDGMMKKMMGDMGGLSVNRDPMMGMMNMDMGMPRMPRMPEMPSMMSSSSAFSSSQQQQQQVLNRGADVFGNPPSSSSSSMFSRQPGFPTMPGMTMMGGGGLGGRGLDIEELNSPGPGN